MNFQTRRKAISLRQQASRPLQFNPFVFSRTFFLWLLVGLVGGIIAGAYWLVLAQLTRVLALVTGWWIIPLMGGAGLLAGLIIHRLGDPGEMSLLVNNIRFRGGRLEAKNNPAMLLSSLLCIASGGSAGPEAPLVQITGSTATWLARKLRVRGENLRTLSIAGMASGFTALFGAPLGGGLFALEILHHRHLSEYFQALIPAFVASCASFVVFILITHIGIGPTWSFPVGGTPRLNDAFAAVGYAVVATAVGWLFIELVRQLRRGFGRLQVPIYAKMGGAGLLLGVLAYTFPLTRYFGHEQLAELLSGEVFTPGFLVVLLLAKLLAIALTVTSGWRGGFIIPLFFVGATLGLLIHQWLPATNLPLAMISCMAALNACATRTPISTAILLATLTGFQQPVPILFASLTGFFLAPRTPLINAQLAVPGMEHDE
jgi:H+/Cl- antiporter ClcA